jgi:hypothetical protein
VLLSAPLTLPLSDVEVWTCGKANAWGDNVCIGVRSDPTVQVVLFVPTVEVGGQQ